MCITKDILLNVDFLKIVIPAGVAILAWVWNERSKRRFEQRKQKEKRYKELLRSLKGFYVGRLDSNLKNQFIDQVNLCWLYAPDEVIQKAHAFFATIQTQRVPLATEAEKERSLGELVMEIRKDMLNNRLISKTRLNALDWKNFQAT